MPRYGFTITLRPENYKFTALYQWFWSATQIRDIMRKHCTEYYFVPELTNAGNVHWHGWIETTSYGLGHIYRFCTKNVGHTLYRTTYKLAYINKEYAKTQRALGIGNIEVSSSASPISYTMEEQLKPTSEVPVDQTEVEEHKQGCAGCWMCDSPIPNTPPNSPRNDICRDQGALGGGTPTAPKTQRPKRHK